MLRSTRSSRRASAMTFSRRVLTDSSFGADMMVVVSVTRCCADSQVGGSRHEFKVGGRRRSAPDRSPTLRAGCCPAPQAPGPLRPLPGRNLRDRSQSPPSALTRNTDASSRWPRSCAASRSAVEQRLLRGDDVEVGRRAAFVARGRQLEHARAPSSTAARACVVGALERRQADDAVLDLLHRGQHDAPVVRDRRVVAGAARSRRWPSSRPAVEQRLRQRRADRPEQARRVEQRRERAALDAERRRRA